MGLSEMLYHGVMTHSTTAWT